MKFWVEADHTIYLGIEVEADSEEQAIALADGTPAYGWENLGSDPPSVTWAEPVKEDDHAG